MSVHVHLAALRQVQLHEYLSRFVLGGAITVASALIARQYGPVLGGLFLAFPAIFPASATLLEKHEREKKQRAGIPRTLRGRLAAAIDARGAAMGAIALVLFAVLVWQELPRHSEALVLAWALVIWFLVAAGIWRLAGSCRHRPRRTRIG